MEELRIPKIRIPLTLSLATGTVEGRIFLADYAPTHAGPERILDVLGGTEPFFPVTVGEKVMIASRQALRWARLKLEHFDDPLLGSTEESVEVRLRDGETFRGVVRFDAPHGRSRLLDHLNSPGHFLPLIEEEHVVLLNRAEVAEVHFLERTT